MSEEKPFFDFPADSADEGSQAIPPILATLSLTQRSPEEIPESSSPSEESNGPGYYVDATVSSSNDSTEGGNESLTSTPVEEIQQSPQRQMLQQQQQLSAAIALHQASVAQQAAQFTANATALQAAQAQQAMAVASEAQAAGNMVIPNASVAVSMATMSLQQPQTMSSVSMPMSYMANGVIANSLTSVAAPPVQVLNPAYSDGTTPMGGTMPVPMVMHQPPMAQSQVSILQQQLQGQHRMVNKDMPPTPPASADEKDHDDPEKKKAMINMIPPNVTVSAADATTVPVPVSLMQFNEQNVAMQATVPGPTGQMVPQFSPTNMMERMPTSMPENQPVYNSIPLPDEEVSPEAVNHSVRPRAHCNKRRSNKKPVPVEEKDDKYFERRKRNNMAAKRSRDARKHREDTIAMRANYLERENAILRAQLATLREEANSLRQLLSQRSMAIGPNGQPVNALQ